eukprot:14328281-Heterocapsa_arctica.AAC.1
MRAERLLGEEGDARAARARPRPLTASDAGTERGPPNGAGIGVGARGVESADQTPTPRACGNNPYTV